MKVNKEKLQQQSLADLKALDDIIENRIYILQQTGSKNNSEIALWEQTSIATVEEINKRINEISPELGL